MADHEVEEEEPQAGPRKGKGKKERNWKDKERTLLITLYDCLWNIVHEDCMNIGIKRKWLTRLTVKSMYRCKRNMVSQGTKANGKFWNKSRPRLLRKSIYYIARTLLATASSSPVAIFLLSQSQTLFWKAAGFCSHWGSKRSCLLTSAAWTFKRPGANVPSLWVGKLSWSCDLLQR